MQDEVNGKIEAICKQIRALAEQLCALNGNIAPDTNEPLLYGNSVDVRTRAGSVQIGIGSAFGWMLLSLDEARASAVAAQISMCVSEVLQGKAALAQRVEAQANIN